MKWADDVIVKVKGWGEVVVDARLAVMSGLGFNHLAYPFDARVIPLCMFLVPVRYDLSKCLFTLSIRFIMKSHCGILALANASCVQCCL